MRFRGFGLGSSDYRMLPDAVEGSKSVGPLTQRFGTPEANVALGWLRNSHLHDVGSVSFHSFAP